MKTLIVYYSRTGTTAKLAADLAIRLGADLDPIIDPADRSGPLGYIRSGREAMGKKLVPIAPGAKDPANYDLVVIGTPIWGWVMSSPVRAYLDRERRKVKNAAFFCTMGGSHGKAFEEMTTFSGLTPIATLALKTAEVMKSEAEEKIKEFAAKLS